LGKKKTWKFLLQVFWAAVGLVVAGETGLCGMGAGLWVGTFGCWGGGAVGKRGKWPRTAGGNLGGGALLLVAGVGKFEIHDNEAFG
jgi:hypothetical protein